MEVERLTVEVATGWKAAANFLILMIGVVTFATLVVVTFPIAVRYANEKCSVVKHDE